MLHVCHVSLVGENLTPQLFHQPAIENRGTVCVVWLGRL